ncbi:MAG TPA: TetR/AcrR family transcriptional regulator C-terminal domain-containing protein [Rhodanobacter sp.]
MKVNPEIIASAALRLLNDIGLEALTLRKLASALHIQAPTLYWHFKSKQALIDEMATLVLAEGTTDLLPAKPSDDWTGWIATFGHGLRKNLLKYRDGGRMIAGTRLTNTVFQETTERIGSRLVEAGFSTRQAIILLSSVYTFTVSFVIEEQAVFPVPGQRSPAYDIKQRNAHLDARKFPLLRQAGTILFDRFDQRYKESLELMLRGASVGLPD